MSKKRNRRRSKKMKAPHKHEIMFWVVMAFLLFCVI